MQFIIRFFVERSLLVNLISIFLLIIGLVTSISLMKIEAFPNVNLDQIFISTSYPGASPKEVEQLVITPIEQELRSLNGIDTMKSRAFPGSGTIVLEVDPDASNRNRLTSEISLAVDRARLPNDLPFDPVVLEIDGAIFPIIRLSISAPLSELELKRVGDDIKNDLLNVDGVAKITILADRKAEIRISIKPEKMIQHKISVRDINQAIRGWNLNAPGGDVNAKDGQKTVRIVGEFSSVEDAENLVLRANDRGQVVRLSDVANVTEELAVPQVLNDVAGEPALSFMVLKKPDADIIKTVDAVKKYLKTVKSIYGDHITVKTFQDFSRFARIRLGVLTNNGFFGLILVFVTLLLFLRFSVAMTTTWGLPIIFMTGIFSLYMAGVTLNLISMMGFIMVLGMLVDDAIIIGENITYHMEKGLNPVEAAVTGAVELFGPVTTTILTTVAAFMPMMFMSGVIGKFVIAIPIVVILLLVFSWMESFLILPSHVAHVTHVHKHPKERAWLLALENFYVKVLKLSLRFRWLTVGLSFAVLIAAIMLAKTMSFQLFPPEGVDEYIVRVTAEPGTNLLTMRQALRDVDKEIRDFVKPEYLQATLAKSGDVSVDQGDPLTQRGSRYGQIRAIYTPAVTRPQHNALDDMYALSKILIKKFPQYDFSLTEIRPGPPVGRALEANLSAKKDSDSELAAKRLMAYLKNVKGVTTIDSGLKRGDDELHLILDRQKAVYAGVDLATVSETIRAATGGLVVSHIRRGIEEIDVTVRFPSSDNEMATLKSLRVPNKRNDLVLLNKISHFEQYKGYTTIRHDAGVRIINVVADVDAKIISSRALNKQVIEQQPKWLGDLFDKVTVKYGGEEEKNQESFVSLLIAFVFALVAIFFILAVQFNNITYPFVVMLAIPFGIIGVIFSFYLHDLYWKPMPLSFFSSMGVVALTGVVVNSSLVLLVFIQRARQQGMEMVDAILQAGRRRLRAVLLTATTTVVGLLPTAYGWGGLDGFVSPMALALSWGLMFSTLVTLVTIPAVLAVGHDIDAFFRRLFKVKPVQTS